MASPAETDLYGPVKAFLETQDYVVKGEVQGADVVALRGDEDPVVVEMKTTFSLTLVHQGIARLALTDWVYLAVPHFSGRVGRKRQAQAVTLCRRVGVGLLTVRLSDGHVAPLLDPGPYRPRQSKVRKGRLLREFHRRAGDPNTGGSPARTVVTAYRQDALRCAAHLSEAGAVKGAAVAAATGVGRATRMMRDNHYGWFERCGPGVYALTDAGAAAVKDAPDIGDAPADQPVSSQRRAETPSP